jgi:hypothetical protein
MNRESITNILLNQAAKQCGFYYEFNIYSNCNVRTCYKCRKTTQKHSHEQLYRIRINKNDYEVFFADKAKFIAKLFDYDGSVMATFRISDDLDFDLKINAKLVLLNNTNIIGKITCSIIDFRYGRNNFFNVIADYYQCTWVDIEVIKNSIFDNVRKLKVRNLICDKKTIDEDIARIFPQLLLINCYNVDINNVLFTVYNIRCVLQANIKRAVICVNTMHRLFYSLDLCDCMDKDEVINYCITQFQNFDSDNLNNEIKSTDITFVK